MINDSKISFIMCVNDEEKYSEAVKYIKSLKTGNFIIEIIPIFSAKSMTSGYNQGMKMSDAKYKVYLHQDVLITNKNFIFDFLEIFNDSEDVGMIGLIGSDKIPENGIWWEETNKSGKVYDNHTGIMQLLAFKEITSLYKEVSIIDGLLMITQVDILWREDIFNNWHFYDASQCLEFIKYGYKVVLPQQENPWCIHDCGVVSLAGYESARHIFLKEYYNSYERSAEK